jgi:hypothetical protein
MVLQHRVWETLAYRKLGNVQKVQWRHKAAVSYKLEHDNKTSGNIKKKGEPKKNSAYIMYICHI